MGFLGFKSETFHHGIKSLRACGDTSLECAQQREGEAREARETRRCGCWKQREWWLHNAAVLPRWASGTGLSLHLHTSQQPTV